MKRALNYGMTVIAWFFAIDYYMLILEGDDSLRRKIIFGIWILVSLVLTIRSVRYKSRKEYKDR